MTRRDDPDFDPRYDEGPHDAAVAIGLGLLLGAAFVAIVARALGLW